MKWWDELLVLPYELCVRSSVYEPTRVCNVDEIKCSPMCKEEKSGYTKQYLGRKAMWIHVRRLFVLKATFRKEFDQSWLLLVGWSINGRRKFGWVREKIERKMGIFLISFGISFCWTKFSGGLKAPFFWGLHPPYLQQQRMISMCFLSLGLICETYLHRRFLFYPTQAQTSDG